MAKDAQGNGGQPSNVCPFMGTYLQMGMPEGSVIRGDRGAVPVIQPTVTECMKTSCALWDKTESACKVALGMDALRALAKARAV